MSQPTSRRDFLRTTAMISGAAMASAAAEPAEAANAPAQTPPARRPNILMVCSDQFRTDFVGANGKDPSVKTPHLDALAARGTNFNHCVSNQPLCSPSRASFQSGVYANRTGVFRLGLEPDHSLPTIATVLSAQGYSTHFIGKWHVSGLGPNSPYKTEPQGWIAPGPSRGGFQTWEGANVLEIVSHPTQGNYWDDSGKNIGFKDIYRVDFLTDRATAMLESFPSGPDAKPWLLYLSQLEPHQQNDVDDMVPPERYAHDYDNAFVPQDLRDLPGNWNSRLKGYYGCVQAIDDCIGKLVATLDKTGQLENTVIVFFSDHGCTFRTRLGEYKRSPHDASIRVPMIFAGPGFDHAVALEEIVSLLDLAPTLIDATGTPVPSTMQGKSLMQLPTDKAARQAWDNTAYIQISASMVGRAIRTPDWTFCAYDPEGEPNKQPTSTSYLDFCMYQNGGDPFQKTNLIGRADFKKQADILRAELKKRIVANNEPEPEMKVQKYYV